MKLLKIGEVAMRIGVSTSTVRNLLNDAEAGFPQGTLITKRSRRWKEADVDQWIATR